MLSTSYGPWWRSSAIVNYCEHTMNRILVTSFLFLCVLLVGVTPASSANAQPKSEPQTAGLWSLLGIEGKVFRINNSTGQTFILRDADSNAPTWVEIRERANSETISDLWDELLEKGKAVVDSNGKAIGLQVPESFVGYDSGVRALDIICTVNGTSVSNAAELRAALKAAQTNKKESVEVEFLRSEKRQTAKVRLTR